MENRQPPDPADPDPPPPYHFFSRRRWLARLSFSFLIVAVYLAYTGFHNGDLGQGRRMLFYFGALLAFVMFLLGTKEKHGGD